MSASASDAVLIIWRSVSEPEQEEIYERLTDERARQQAGGEGITARMIRSLIRVRDEIGRVPGVTDYRQVSKVLRLAGEDVESFTRVYEHFGSWPRALEALQLSKTTSARRIEARFRYRQLGKVWRYTEDTLRETLTRCAEHYGRPPLVAEFDWWRQRELELAVAAGNPNLHLPSPSPYRKRWGSWEGALLHFGYPVEAVELRLEQA